MNAAERNSVVVREKSLGFISGERREAACRRGSERVERERAVVFVLILSLDPSL